MMGSSGPRLFEMPGGFLQAYMFGVHVGAFHGGVMRIENTEITRSGQALGNGMIMML